jgi:hypothetical protein
MAGSVVKVHYENRPYVEHFPVLIPDIRLSVIGMDIAADVVGHSYDIAMLCQFNDDLVLCRRSRRCSAGRAR